MVFLRFEKEIGSCLRECHLAGNKEIATNNPIISIQSPILKGKFKLIFVKKGRAIIKNILKKETRHFIDEEIFLKLCSLFKLVRVSCKKADVFQVEKASVHRDINTAPTKKYQKLSPIIYIKLEISISIFAITIVVLFPNLSHIIQAGIWKSKDIAYQAAV